MGGRTNAKNVTNQPTLVNKLLLIFVRHTYQTPITKIHTTGTSPKGVSIYGSDGFPPPGSSRPLRLNERGVVFEDIDAGEYTSATGTVCALIKRVLVGIVFIIPGWKQTVGLSNGENSAFIDRHTKSNTKNRLYLFLIPTPLLYLPNTSYTRPSRNMYKCPLIITLRTSSPFRKLFEAELISVVIPSCLVMRNHKRLLYIPAFE